MFQFSPFHKLITRIEGPFQPSRSGRRFDGLWAALSDLIGTVDQKNSVRGSWSPGSPKAKGPWATLRAGSWASPEPVRDFYDWVAMAEIARSRHLPRVKSGMSMG